MAYIRRHYGIYLIETIRAIKYCDWINVKLKSTYVKFKLCKDEKMRFY